MPIGAYLAAAHDGARPRDAGGGIARRACRARLPDRGHALGTFDLADEPLDEPPRRFRAEAQRLGLRDDQAWVMKVGETRSW